MTRILCEGKACPRSRGRRPGDAAWPRWICPKCWAHARADTRAGICRLREQLSKAWRRNNRADIDAITKRLFVVWDMANSQINAGINRKNRQIEEPAHVDAAE